MGSIPIRVAKYARLAQRDEHLPYKQGVVGSIPTACTNISGLVGSGSPGRLGIFRYWFDTNSSDQISCRYNKTLNLQKWAVSLIGKTSVLQAEVRGSNPHVSTMLLSYSGLVWLPCKQLTSVRIRVGAPLKKY